MPDTRQVPDKVWSNVRIGMDPKKVPCRNPRVLSPVLPLHLVLIGLSVEGESDPVDGLSHLFPARRGRQSRAKDSEAWERMTGSWVNMF